MVLICKEYIEPIHASHGLRTIRTPLSLTHTHTIKEQWKKEVKSKLHAYVEQQWKEDMTSKSSLEYLNPGSVKVGKAHPVFPTVRNNTHDAKRAEVKVRILTGTCTLQSNRAKLSQFNVSPICHLCNIYPETREHFLTSCEVFRVLRIESMNIIRALFDYSSEITDLLNNTELCTQLRLDASHPDVDRVI